MRTDHTFDLYWIQLFVVWLAKQPGTCFNVDTGAVVFKNGLSPNSGPGWFNYDVKQLEHWRAGQEWDCGRQPCHTGPRSCLHNEPPPD